MRNQHRRTVCYFTVVEKVAYFQRGYTMILVKKFHIFRAFFSVKETLVLSFDNFVFLKGGFLDDKNVILL